MRERSHPGRRGLYRVLSLVLPALFWAVPGAFAQQLSVTPSSHDFGELVVGGVSESVSWTVENTGTGDLLIHDVSLGGGIAAVSRADFAICYDDCSGRGLAAGRQCFVEVLFTPLSAGPLDETLVVDSSAQTVSVSLSGQGLDLADAADRVIENIEALDLPQGTERSFTAVLGEVADLLGDGNPNNDAAARNRLATFLRRVEQDQASNNPQLTPAEAAELRALVGPLDSQVADEDRQRVQGISREIACQLKHRGTNQTAVDNEIAVLRQLRTPSLVRVATEDNPFIQTASLPGLYRVESGRVDGRRRYLFGSIEVAWHLAEVLSSAFTLGEQLASSGGEMAIAGTAVQGRIHPFLTDIDFDETIEVVSATAGDAAREVTERIIDFVEANETAGNVEFLTLGFPGSRTRSFSRQEVLAARTDSSLFNMIATGIENLQGNMNTFWRGFLADGRFLDITKVIYVDARTPGGAVLIANTSTPDLNLALLEEPSRFEAHPLGIFAIAMCRQAWIRLDDGGGGSDVLKSAKRAFNYFSTIGDLEFMGQLEPLFRTPQAGIAPQFSVLEGLERVLGSDTETRILTLAEARSQALAAADAIENTLPPGAGVFPSPAAIAATVRDLASRFEGTAAGYLAKFPEQAEEMADLLASAKLHVNAGLRDAVEPIVLDHVRPVCSMVERLPGPPRIVDREFTPKLIYWNGIYTHTLVVEDPDGLDGLTYSLLSGPTGMTIDGTGTITWPAPFSERGRIFEVTPQVSDGMFSDSFSYDLQVVDLVGTLSSPVPVGGSSAVSLTIESIGTGNLEVFTVDLTGEDANEEWTLAFDGCSGAVLPPGSTCVIDLQLAPTSQGLKSATLVVDWNDPTPPILYVGVQGLATNSAAPSTETSIELEIGGATPQCGTGNSCGRIR